MNSEKNTSRLLGAAFLIVILTSLIGGLMVDSAVGSGTISAALANIAGNLIQVRIGILLMLLNSVGIVALAALLYAVLSRQNRLLARIALGLWLAEAIFYAISQMGVFALIPLSRDFVQAGSPANSYYQELGAFLYSGVYKQGMSLHMWFYNAGGLLWYSLFYQSRTIPRAISLLGLIAVALSILGNLGQFLGLVVPIYFFLPLLPFELTIGAWLLLRGAQAGVETGPSLASAGIKA